MEILVFDLRAEIAHFRRPDTTTTHATYPFITGTAARGILGAILGLDEFICNSWVGVQLLSPIWTRTQQLSLLGKGFLSSGRMFNRPASIELVVSPHYRIYYAGAHIAELSRRIAGRFATYPTYLGSAFALCVPEFQDLIQCQLVEPRADEFIQLMTVVPVHTIIEMGLPNSFSNTPYQLARVSGLLYEYKGNREFSGTISLIYEVEGRPINARIDSEVAAGSQPVKFARLENDMAVALW